MKKRGGAGWDSVDIGEDEGVVLTNENGVV